VFDHIGVACTDLAASERFYRTVLSALGIEPTHADAALVEWEDWAIGPTDAEHPVTRGLHVAFRAPSGEAVDAFGGVQEDPDGNTVEAVLAEGDSIGHIEQIRLRVRDLAASERFYSTIAPYGSGVLLVEERPLTENVHIAFPASDDATVRAFHATALAAGYDDHGGPGERAVYHPGYYGAFVLDPDGHNVEVVNHNR
jgi:catechol 2,3-dioxygenase-like lactoylglutathione lyase family enzyme